MTDAILPAPTVESLNRGFLLIKTESMGLPGNKADALLAVPVRRPFHSDLWYKTPLPDSEREAAEGADERRMGG